MKKTCIYCGIVDEDHVCPHRKDKRRKENTAERRFRSSTRWKNKSIEIKERDRYLCRICLIGKYNSISLFNYQKLEAHHIVPISEAWDLRLENNNLITLCSFHHHMAEKGEIPREELKRMVEEKQSPPAFF